LRFLITHLKITVMIDQSIKTKLLDINQSFYDRYSGSFSATRHQVQPGVHRLIQIIPPHAKVLDVGCGNGTLARALAAHGFTGAYLGADLSDGLLEQARQLLKDPPSGSYTFQRIDLSNPHWSAAIPQQSIDWLVCFAVLHHLPGHDLRLQTALACGDLLAPHGTVAISVWQWQNSQRLRKRVLPWSTVGLDSAALDDGDVLLDWRSEEEPGLRYIHTFDEASLTALADQAGFNVHESFYSDGQAGNLALYQTWQKA
jgi:tRNA (uracil-5-)-methyltransferase TRM9